MEVTLMATDKDNKVARAYEAKDSMLRDVGLLALPVLAFQRNMLKIVKKGIQEAGLHKPVQTLAEHELHASFMILESTAKRSTTVGAEIEKKMKDSLDRVVPKGLSGAVELIDAQYEILTKLIDALDMVMKKQPSENKY